jgi:hypothetical protein
VPDLRVEAPRPQAPIGPEPFHLWTLPDGTAWLQFHRTGAGYVLRFPGFADFAVGAADLAVRCVPCPGVGERVVQHLYLNQVLPLVRSRQGRMVFHGSAVEAGSGAVVFMGASGRGKSTLAASFVAGGFRFMADDGISLSASRDGLQVEPGHPSIRLWADSRATLMGPEHAPEPALPYTEKACYLASDETRFCAQPRDLRRIYFLSDERSDAVTIQAITPADALIELVRHSFLLDIRAPDMLAAHFEGLVRLVRSGTCFRLDYPRRFDAIPAIRAAIIRHCGD